MPMSRTQKQMIDEVITRVQQTPGFVHEADPVMQLLTPEQRKSIRERYHLWAATWIIAPLENVLSREPGSEKVI